MTEEKSRLDSEEQDALISDLYSQTATEQPPESLDAKILTEAHQAVTDGEKKPLSTAWKAAFSLAAVLVIGLAVVLEVGIVTYDQGVFEKPVIREMVDTAEEGAMDDLAAPVEAGSAASPEPAMTPMKMESQLKKRVMPSIEKPAAPAAKQQRHYEAAPRRNGIAADVEMMEESRVLRQDTLQSPGNAASQNSKKIAPPEIWLSNIHQLIEQGERQRAVNELIEFKRHYPDIDITALENITTLPIE